MECMQGEVFKAARTLEDRTLWFYIAGAPSGEAEWGIDGCWSPSFPVPTLSAFQKEVTTLLNPLYPSPQLNAHLQILTVG